MYVEYVIQGWDFKIKNSELYSWAYLYFLPYRKVLRRNLTFFCIRFVDFAVPRTVSYTVSGQQIIAGKSDLSQILALLATSCVTVEKGNNIPTIF